VPRQFKQYIISVLPRAKFIVFSLKHSFSPQEEQSDKSSCDKQDLLGKFGDLPGLLAIILKLFLNVAYILPFYYI
jgi:hypothetical protein